MAKNTEKTETKELEQLELPNMPEKLSTDNEIFFVKVEYKGRPMYIVHSKIVLSPEQVMSANKICSILNKLLKSNASVKFA